MRKISDEALAKVLANSYRNFHAKGFDYLCLARRDDLTLKVYFFDDFDDKQPVVHPHDHRYDSTTSVVRGLVTNTVFKESSFKRPNSVRCDEFRFYTPLNGGDGFVYEGVSYLEVDCATLYNPGEQFRLMHETIHTLHIRVPGTVLVQEQYADKVPRQAPTSTFLPITSAELPKPPQLTGLYDRFTADQALARLQQLDSISPGATSWVGN